MRLYKPVSLSLCVIFTIVGLLFITIPGKVINFFNEFSQALGMQVMPVESHGFYLILAAGYMYLVALLAFLMYRHPEQTSLPFLLFSGKLATSLLSLGMFLFQEQFLIYITNFAVDGLIGVVILFLYTRHNRPGLE